MKKQKPLEYGIFSAIILVGIALDQLTKWLAVKFLMPIVTHPIIKNVLHLTYVENRGAAFGSFSDQRWVFMVISTVAIIALLIYLWKFRPDSILACSALSMIIGGGIGNMIDRVFLGYVVDFLDFCAFPNLWVWVFNVADAFVCVGAGMLILYLVLEMVKDFKAEKAKKLSATEQKNPTEDKE